MNSFIWGSEMPKWFASLAHSYRYNPDTKQIELPTTTGNVIVNPGDAVHMDEAGVFTVLPKEHKLNREQRRASMKHDETLTVSQIIVKFDNGQQVELDSSKVTIVDKETGTKLFKEVLEQQEQKA